MSGRSSFGSIRQRDVGRWQARWQDAAGHQHSRTFPTKRQAAAWLSNESTDRARGDWVDPRHGRETFEAFANRWRTSVVNLRPSTRDRDFGYLGWYLLPEFGKMELAAIDHMHVRAFLADMGVNHAPATVVKAAQIMNKIMRAAVLAKRIPSNPCVGVKLPTVERAEMRYLDAAQLHHLADCIDDRYRAAILVAGKGGLRAGELFGLKIRNVNPMHGTVTVVEQVAESSGHLYLGPPKTKAGRRTVPLPGDVMDALDAHLHHTPDALVFPAPHGGYVRLASWRQRTWRPALVAAGLEGLRIHDLRHTAIALWIDAGASHVSIARRAGHTSTAVVLDRYGHLYEAKEAEITASLDRRDKPM